MEFPLLIGFFAYIYYLRFLADKRTSAEKEAEKLSEHIALYRSGNLPEAFAAFSQRLADNPRSSVSYLYRGLCFRDMGNFADAMKDIHSGISIDNTSALLYTELGKLQSVNNQTEEALASFATAIRVSRGQAPEPYHERGTLLLLLNRSAEAEIDFATENFILEQEEKEKQTVFKTAGPSLFDRKLLLNSLLVLITSAILALSVKAASSIHLPYLTAVLLSVPIGFAEPRRGWVLAILQSILLFVACIYLIARPTSQGRTELEYFSMFGSIALTFAASFLGAFLKRAIGTH